MAETEEVVSQPKSKTGLWKWALIGLLGAGFSADASFRAMIYWKGTPVSADSSTTPVEGHAAEAAAKPDEQKPKKPEVKSAMVLDAFLVNLADKEFVRFVKASFRLGFDDAKLGDDLSKDSIALAVTRDAIISLLSSKTSEEILTLEGKKKLRKEILEKVNEVLTGAKVREVYIMDFQVQL